MNIVFSKRAFKELSQFSGKVQERIMKKIRFFMAQKEPLHFAKSLQRKDLGDYRFRIGDYRVTVEVNGNTIYVLNIRHRKDAYE